MQLGIIEGYYGRPWTWQERADTMRFLAPFGYQFYMYAPKADPHLRKYWREEHPRDVADEIKRLSAQCRDAGVRFGVGLSPTKLHIDFGKAAQEALGRKLAEVESFGLDFLALLFDDMRGDVPDLAKHQIEITHWTAERTNVKQLYMCPSYYTDDPVLDRVFGQRPDGYVEELGRGIDPSIPMFWTGEEVCSREISVGHMQRVAEQMRRQPFLWDNYPVNDGERMSQFLHVRSFTGRDAGVRNDVVAHGVNPALQPHLSRIAAISLARVYEQANQYQYGAAFLEAAILALGEEVGRKVYQDALMLQDIGLDRLGDKADYLRGRYDGVDNPGAREIIEWLNGGYRITDEIVRQQSGED
jgi:hyaluronoglucosaminidase